MDLKRKIELMKKYDFGGFGNKVATIDCCITNLTMTTDPTKSESEIENMNEVYEWLQSKYTQINFDEITDEMSEGDNEDFATLFMTREALPTLRVALDNLIVFLRKKKNYRVSTNNKVWLAAEMALQRVKSADNYNGMEYRRRLQNLEYKLQSEPK